jgi:hypothetical protein
MNNAKFEARRTSVNGKPAIQLVVFNSLSNPELHQIIDALGYKPMTNIRNARSIMCFSQSEALAARDPIVKFFNEDGSAK